MLDPKVKSSFMEKQVDRYLRSGRSKNAQKVKCAREEGTNETRSRGEIVCSQEETRLRKRLYIMETRSREEKRSREYQKRENTWPQEIELHTEKYWA